MRLISWNCGGGFAKKAAYLDSYNPAHRHILPLRIGGPRSLTLFAIWTLPDERRRYTGHLWRALQEYEPLLTGDVLLIGDFNSNAIWDDKHRRTVSHTNIVTWLAEIDIVSLYHEQTGEAQGGESTPTFYQKGRTLEGPYHLDYAFASRSLREVGARPEVLPVEEWIASGRSDHVVLSVEWR